MYNNLYGNFWKSIISPKIANNIYIYNVIVIQVKYFNCKNIVSP